MSSPRYLKALRKTLVRVAGSQNLVSLAGGTLEESTSLEGMNLDSVRPAEALSKLQNEDFDSLTPPETVALEAIVEREGRQVVFINQHKFQDLPHPWDHFNAGVIRDRIEAATKAIGRVEIMTPSGKRTQHLGTGFIVAERLLMTNRHVAELFVQGVGEQALAFIPGMPSAAFDFGREDGFNPLDLTGTLRLTGIRMVHPYWDMALLELSDLAETFQPLTLSVESPEDLLGREIATIGYPGRGRDLSATAQELEAKVFQNIYGVKRLAPGFIDGSERVQSYNHLVPAMIHDCSTLAGNSGSAIIDVTTGHVIGLHFKGATLKANYSVPLHELARDPRVRDAGLNFFGTVSSTAEWDAWWRNTARPEAASDPSSFSSAHPPASSSIIPPTPAMSAPDSPVASSTWTIPITLNISIGAATPIATVATKGTSEGQIESFQIPIMYDGMEQRSGYNPNFLELENGEQVPLPKLTAKGEKAVVRLEDGTAELKYHHFSILMHKKRRLALFTAANVDWRKPSRQPTGVKLTRAVLSGIPEGVQEQWVTDDRIADGEQLPDIFFTKDKTAFDKGHLVRRDDVAYGTSFEDVQMANGDTYYTTNCSPQVKEFNQAAYGVFNWGDLEAMVEKQTKSEKVIVFSGPVLSKQDRFFLGITETGPAKIQIPQHFWKIIVARTDEGVRAFGFLPKQDLKKVPLEEFALPQEWLKHQVSIQEIEDNLSGLVTLDWCKQYDALG